jgi:hypothetical protein
LVGLLRIVEEKRRERRGGRKVRTQSILPRRVKKEFETTRGGGGRSLRNPRKRTVN